MPTFELKPFPSAEALASAAARDLVNLVESRRSPEAPWTIALPGGRIAKKFFDEVANLAREREALFRGVHFFWGDERCVPPEHADSNFAEALGMLEVLRIPKDRIHRIQGELPPEEACKRVEQALGNVATQDDGGRPLLDLVVLGMGEDGHVASIFPGAMREAIEGPAWVLPVTGPKPPPRRITLTMPVLVAAREVWVLASGPGKEKALQNSLSAAGATPLAVLLNHRRRTLIYSDIQGISATA